MKNIGDKVLFEVLLLINFIFLLKINSLLIITICIYSLIFILINKILFKKVCIKYLNIFLLFIFFSIIIYLFQLNTLPNHFGFSGDGYVIGGGYGTDDSYFYSRAIDYYSTYKDLPTNFPLRKNFNKYILKAGFNFYSWFLSRFIYLIELYKKIEPLDLIFVNSLILSFLPIFTSKLSFILFRNKKIENSSLILTIISPVLLANGLVLVRDGLAATFFVGTLYYYFEKNNYLLIFMLSFLFLIREESGLQAMVVLLIIYFLKQNLSKKIWLIIFGGCVIVILCYLYQEKILILTGGSFFYRKNFVESFLANNGNGKNGGIYKIQQLNIFFRIPLSMLAFYLSPLFSLKKIYINNLFIIRWFLYFFMYPIINLFCIGYFTKMLFFIKEDKNLQFIFFSFLFLLYFVSQFSFQMRHTTMYIPLYYILCSYGMWKRDNNYKQLKWFTVILTVILYLGINFI